MATAQDTRRRERLKRVQHLYALHELFGPDICVYCGEQATTRDHVPPVAYMDELLDAPAYHLDMAQPVLVPACFDCNVRLSGCRLCQLADRREELKRRLKHRWWRLLGEYDWQPKELARLGHSLRTHIEDFEARRRFILRRMAFPTAEEEMLLRVESDPVFLEWRQKAPRAAYSGPYHATEPSEAPISLSEPDPPKTAPVAPAPDWPALAASWPYRQLALLPVWGLEPLPPTRRSRWC